MLQLRSWRTLFCYIYRVANGGISPEGVEVSLATSVSIGILGPINIPEGRFHDHSPF